MNKEGPLPSNAILVSIDVSVLYTNIPQEEGLDATKEALEDADNLTIPPDFIVRMLELVLKYNIFRIQPGTISSDDWHSHGHKACPFICKHFYGQED